MANGLADLGSPIEDRILILNILRRLNQHFKHMGSIIRSYSPFPNFLKVQDDLLLEEIHMDSTDPPAAPTALYTNAAPPTAKPPSSTPSRLPSCDNGGNRNKNCNSGNGGSNNGRSSNGRSSSFGQTTAPTTSNNRTDASWPTYGHLWQGHMTVYPGSVPAGQQRPQAFMATPDLYPSPGFLPTTSSSCCTSRPPPLPH
jgi:hypothetical protein